MAKAPFYVKLSVVLFSSRYYERIRYMIVTATDASSIDTHV